MSQPFWSEVIHNLYVCGMYEWPAEFAGLLVCVLEDRPIEEPTKAVHVPILDDNGKAVIKQLDIVSDIIAAHIQHGPVVIHCGAGIERSPLAVVWYLHRERGLSFAEAYAFVMAKRSVVQDRMGWLPIGYNDARS